MWKAKFTKPLTVAMTPEMYYKIKQITDEEEISKADLVRGILDEQLSKWEQDPLMSGLDQNEVSKA